MDQRCTEPMKQAKIEAKESSRILCVEKKDDDEDSKLDPIEIPDSLSKPIKMRRSLSPRMMRE